jgi:hypothetical protein
VLRLLAVTLAAIALGASIAAAADTSIQPLPAQFKAGLTGEFWHEGCPVGLSDLRLLTVRHWGFDGRAHTGQLVVNKAATAPLAQVFRKLYALKFPIRHLQLSDLYVPAAQRPADNDVSGSFQCREAVPSPCAGGNGNKGNGSWSNHAYGLAVDLNPAENPYVGCGTTRDKRRLPYLDRSHLRPGMVTPAVIAAFASIGWEWGGAWSGSTKDYMHFSVNGR